jgi:transaldolase
MTRETFLAYLDHGRPEPRLASDRNLAHEQMRALGTLGIDFSAITEALEREGVDAFTSSFRSALDTIAAKRRRLSAA